MQEHEKRPNTKGLVSRRYRQTRIAVRVINSQTDQFRTVDLEIIDKKDPVRAAREKVKLEPYEMILRASVISDRYVIVTQTPEEFLFYGKVKEYIPITKNERNAENEND